MVEPSYHKSMKIKKSMILQSICLLFFGTSFAKKDHYKVFVRPIGYVYGDTDEWIHTKKYEDTVYTSGSWETDYQFNVLNIDDDEIPDTYKEIFYEAEEDGFNKPERERRRESTSFDMLRTLEFLKEWKSVLIPNVFGTYDLALGKFTPELDGYLQMVHQRGGFYYQLGKIFFYLGMIGGLLSFFARLRPPKFEFVDPNPRSLSNKIQRKFFPTGRVKISKIQNKNLIFFFVAGSTLACGCVLGTQFTIENNKNFDLTARKQSRTVMQMITELDELQVSLQNVAKQDVHFTKSIFSNEKLRIRDLIPYIQKGYEKHKSKIESFHSKILASTPLVQPYPFIATATISSFLLLGQLFKDRMKLKHFSIFCAFAFVLTTTYWFFCIGSTFSYQYLFSDQCNSFADFDSNLLAMSVKPKDQEYEKEVSGGDANLSMYPGMSEYIHCYDYHFQEQVKKQMVEIQIGQSALFKNTKIILENDFTKEEREQFGFNIPRNIPELQSMKFLLYQPEERLEDPRNYLDMIEFLNDIKAKVGGIPNCVILNPWYDNAKRSICNFGQENGLVIIGSQWCVIIGSILCIFASYHSEEISREIEATQSNKNFQWGLRYNNFVERKFPSMIIKSTEDEAQNKI